MTTMVIMNLTTKMVMTMMLMIMIRSTRLNQLLESFHFTLIQLDAVSAPTTLRLHLVPSPTFGRAVQNSGAAPKTLQLHHVRRQNTVKRCPNSAPAFCAISPTLCIAPQTFALAFRVISKLCCGANHSPVRCPNNSALALVLKFTKILKFMKS